MNLYDVSLDTGQRLDIGPFRSPMLWGCRVEAADETEAVARAREKLSESPGFAEYAPGKVHRIERIHRYAITLRGKRDKRRRETYYANGASEERAINQLGRHNHAVWEFAGSLSSRRQREAAIVKIEVID